jgi:hypothetical protein
MPWLTAAFLLFHSICNSESAVFASYEARYERISYKFENPSRFNTSFLVPHNFRQRYHTDGHWGIIGVRYFLAGANLESRFGITPERVRFGEDVDTFFQPDGNVIVSGTQGDVSLRSILFFQEIEVGRWKGFLFEYGYRYQRDRFHYLPSPFFILQTKPPSEIRGFNTAEETTKSQVHEMEVGAVHNHLLSKGWMLEAEFRVSPIILAHLSILLPQKYPGRELTFLAPGFGATGGLTMSRTATRFPIQFFIRYGKSWPYQDSSQFHRKSVAAGFTIGYAL